MTLNKSYTLLTIYIIGNIFLSSGIGLILINLNQFKNTGFFGETMTWHMSSYFLFISVLHSVQRSKK